MPNYDSPLRYPGGKTKLYDLVRPIITENIHGNNRIYTEPFAGGSGLALKLLFQDDVDHLILNDIDNKLYSFWNSCLNHTDQLCQMIEECEITIDNWNIQKRIYTYASQYTELEIGFATFFLNRCNVSGVIRGGPIGGQDQSGAYPLDARFKKKSLIDKIQQIGDNRNRIEFYNMDAIHFLLDVVPQYDIDNTILNIDPPYVKKGPILYENSFTTSNHAELSNIIQVLKHKWIVTYDECDLIYNLYNKYRKEIITLNYSAGTAKKGQELIIYSDNIIVPKSSITAAV